MYCYPEINALMKTHNNLMGGNSDSVESSTDIVQKGGGGIRSFGKKK